MFDKEAFIKEFTETFTCGPKDTAEVMAMIDKCNRMAVFYGIEHRCQMITAYSHTMGQNTGSLVMIDPDGNDSFVVTHD